MTLSVQFAPGTFDRATSRLTIELDTGQNPSTGVRTADGLGVEYALDMFAPASQTSILKAIPRAACTATDPCYVPMGTTPLSVLADGMGVTMPLSLVGSADGRLNFRVLVYASRSGGAVPITADVMPDIGVAPGHVP